MGARNRLYIRGTSDTAAVRAIEAIDRQEQLLWNATLIQWTAYFTQAPTTSQFFEVGKLSAVGIGYEFVFRKWDPTVNGGLQMTCNEHFEIGRSEVLFIRYPNTDAILIGYEAILKEVD